MAGPVDIEWSLDALADLGRFATFLHEQHPELAARVAHELIARAEVLRRHPKLGRPLTLRDEYREVVRQVLGGTLHVAVSLRRPRDSHAAGVLQPRNTVTASIPRIRQRHEGVRAGGATLPSGSNWRTFGSPASHLVSSTICARADQRPRVGIEAHPRRLTGGRARNVIAFAGAAATC